jgi:hypothetical protein
MDKVPDLEPRATETVIEQAKLLADDFGTTVYRMVNYGNDPYIDMAAEPKV